jgi:hypothetical protein
MPIKKRTPFVPRKPAKRMLTPDEIDTMKSALMMFILSLQPGSDVDVFCKKEGCFYEATVVDAGCGGGFCYAYKNGRNKQGFVYFKDCLGTWRPPLKNQRHLTPKKMLLFYDSINP